MARLALGLGVYLCVGLAAIGAIVASAVSATLAHASRRDWTGSAACGVCHPAELAAWQATPHARTRDRFAARPEPRCLGCHATGEAPAGPTIGESRAWGVGTPTALPAGRGSSPVGSIAVEVGCEACHGAGAGYAEDDVMRDRPVALALGLADVSTPKARAAVCASCHRTSTRRAPFDPMAPVHPTAVQSTAAHPAPR